MLCQVGQPARRHALAAIVALLTGSGSDVLSAATSEDIVRRGAYLSRAAGCASCHTDRDPDGPLLAGGRALKTPFGTFYAPNITPDPKHGIGRWSDEDFVRALARGVSPRGSHYYPAFPYTAYTRIRREDLLALKAYLLTVPAIARPNREHELRWYVRWRTLLGIWKWFFFTPGEFRPEADRSDEWNRGAYLATALGHCEECHTPRDAFGALDKDQRYAGTRDGPEGERVPNITPDRTTGIGRWREDDIAYFLETGATPEGDYAGSLMAEVVDDSTSQLSAPDRKAIALYLRSLPAIEHAVQRKKKPRRDPYQ